MQSSATISPSPPIQAPNLRVLVVDDEQSVGFFLTRLLRPWDVTVVVDGLTAAERIAEEPWDVILCDLTLPGVGGAELFALATADQRRRFLFMTGGAYTPEAEQFLASCDEPPLYKPFDPRELRGRVEQLVKAVGRAPRG
ncbi:MAG: hypothetical protein CVU56_12310 [Deltaproteobacteria bacterium HGW-Deltaproteobacteria-14]|jgi:CheY-like chemotaxis protein|nr:MAG: hypothetical protein CVU56_12310 [Deltaproteobacteria bacterium HGW-Deltaproteobacteria-14]